jgi:hypothetical protein
MEVTKELGAEFHGPDATHVLLFEGLWNIPEERERRRKILLVFFVEG